MFFGALKETFVFSGEPVVWRLAIMNEPYDVVIIGGGASGTSLLYTLARYSTIPRVLLIEKYDKPGQVNSRASNNSQTLHVGDIETNYPLEKVRQVRPAALMLVRYAEMQPEAVRDTLLFTMPKMVLAVGEHEVSVLEKRFSDISSLFPDLQKIDREAIALIEPAVVAGRSVDVPLCALATLKGYAVDYERLAQSFVDEALRARPEYAVSYESEVVSIVREGNGYVIQMKGRGARTGARRGRRC